MRYPKSPSRYLVIAAVAATFGAAPSAAVAATPESLPQTTDRKPLCWQPFAEIDQDADGMISDTEVTARETVAFNGLDENNDGIVDWSEFVECAALNPGAPSGTPRDVHIESRTKKDFDATDANKDGMIDASEYLQHTGELYGSKFRYSGISATVDRYGNVLGIYSYSTTAADRNKDGVVSADEGAADVHRRFAALDRNGDMKLSLDEWVSKTDMEAAQRRFRSLDKNDDGKVTQDEYRLSAQKRWKEHTGPKDAWMYRSYRYY